MVIDRQIAEVKIPLVYSTRLNVSTPYAHAKIPRYRILNRIESINGWLAGWLIPALQSP